MIAAYTLYYASVERSTVGQEKVIIDYSDGSTQGTRPAGYSHFVNIPPSSDDPAKYLVWWAEFLLIKLGGYPSRIPILQGLLEHVTVPTQRHLVVAIQEMRGTIADFRPFPNFDDIKVVSIGPYAQPVDFRTTFQTALKVFKRVFVEGGLDGTGLDQVVPQNRALQVGSVQFVFAAVPGMPRLLTWRNMARAAMAMIQFMKEHEFKEVRASVTIHGITVAKAEVNVRRPVTQSFASQSSNVTVI